MGLPTLTLWERRKEGENKELLHLAEVLRKTLWEETIILSENTGNETPYMGEVEKIKVEKIPVTFQPKVGGLFLAAGAEEQTVETTALEKCRGDVRAPGGVPPFG